MIELKELNWDKYRWNSKENIFKTSLMNSYKKKVRGIVSETDAESKMLSEGYLVEAPDGELWHVLQMPYYWKDGSRSGKEKIKLPIFATDIYSMWNHHQLTGLIIDDKSLKKMIINSTHYSLYDCIITDEITSIDFKNAEECLFMGLNIHSNPTRNNSIIFKNCVFKNQINITKSTFENLSFISCNLTNIEIKNCKITGKLEIDGRDVKNNKCLKYVTIRKTEISSDFYIININAKELELLIRSSVFHKDVHITAQDTEAIKLFSWRIGASIFKESLRIYTNYPLPPSVFFKSQISDTFIFEKCAIGKQRQLLIPNTKTAKEFDNIGFWNRTVTGSQELRKLMEKTNDKISEWIFYDIEHYAKLQIAKLEKRFVPFDYLYEICSGNGLSLTKPLIALFLLWLVPSLIYLATQAYSLSQQGEVVFSPEAVFNGLIVSGSQMVLGSFKGDNKWIEFITCMEEHSFYLSVIDRIVAFSQNLFSIVLVFLFGLALRRRYQV